MKLVEVKDTPELIKDVESGGIYFNDDMAIRNHNSSRVRKESNNKMQGEIDQLKNDIGDIKSMLEKLINK